MKYLYRGVNKDSDQENAGQLVPAGDQEEVAMPLDGSWCLDGSWRIGECEHNAARAHQRDTGLYGAACISTTRSSDQAIKFATYGGQDGYVYVIDEQVLEKLGIHMQEFDDPEHPHECEVTLILPDMAAVPSEAIVEKIEILDGKPIRRIP